MLSENEPHLFRFRFIKFFNGYLFQFVQDLPAGRQKATINGVLAHHKDLLDALAALEPHVRIILDLPREWARGRTTVIGAGFAGNKKTDEKVKVELKTTYMPFVFTSAFLPLRVLPSDTIEALDRLRREAVAFINGKRTETNG